MLAQIPSDRGSRIRDVTTHHSSFPRSPTVEPPEADALAQVKTSPDAYRNLLRPWTRYPDTSDPEDWQVISIQRDRWKEFCSGQLHNRRQTVSFSEYLDEQRLDFMMSGGQPQLDGDDDGLEAVFSRYSEDKYQTAKAKADHQQRRVDWVRSEISKIEAEQKAAGNSDDANGVDGVQPRVGKRNLPADEDPPEPKLKTKKVAGRRDDSRTTRSKKCKLSADEDAPEPTTGGDREGGWRE
ncbi:MAG: hypothetical protein M1816_003477 [Peltula sp. TS41687]|nr:MAG: hypothetical protein M1816_003477 [Peltula sp. TS41687]